MSSYIIHRDRARQLIDFSNLRFGTRMPTDIDGCFEYDDRAMILLEFKYGDAPMSLGQMLALTRNVDNNQKAGKESALFVCRHSVEDCEEDIDAAEAIVSDIYYKQQWYSDGKSTVKKRLKSFIKYVDSFKTKGE